MTSVRRSPAASAGVPRSGAPSIHTEAPSDPGLWQATARSLPLYRDRKGRRPKLGASRPAIRGRRPAASLKPRGNRWRSTGAPPPVVHAARRSRSGSMSSPRPRPVRRALQMGGSRHHPRRRQHWNWRWSGRVPPAERTDCWRAPPVDGRSAGRFSAREGFDGSGHTGRFVGDEAASPRVSLSNGQSAWRSVYHLITIGSWGRLPGCKKHRHSIDKVAWVLYLF